MGRDGDFVCTLVGHFVTHSIYLLETNLRIYNDIILLQALRLDMCKLRPWRL